MTAERPKLSRGGATHRREELSKARRHAPPDSVEQIISQSQKDQARLTEITKKLENRNSLTPEQRAELTVEMIWLRYKLNQTDKCGRESELNDFLNNLKEENSAVHNWLTQEDGQDGFAPLARIRDQVIPRTVGGYHTKRGR